MENIIYRAPETEKEIASAAEVERICLATAWSEAQIADLPSYAVYIAAFCGNTVCGIASMYAIAGEGQIMNVAVLPQYRRKGIANGLMTCLAEKAAKRNCDIITLEVAENNTDAIALYEKHGFTAIGRRKGFYSGTDAINMEKKL